MTQKMVWPIGWGVCVLGGGGDGSRPCVGVFYWRFFFFFFFGLYII
jgi:hypothetical protein